MVVPTHENRDFSGNHMETLEFELGDFTSESWEALESGKITMILPQPPFKKRRCFVAYFLQVLLGIHRYDPRKSSEKWGQFSDFSLGAMKILNTSRSCKIVK